MTGFFIGLVLGGFVGICVMALFQINVTKVHKEEDNEQPKDE